MWGAGGARVLGAEGVGGREWGSEVVVVCGVLLLFCTIKCAEKCVPLRVV